MQSDLRTDASGADRGGVDMMNLIIFIFLPCLTQESWDFAVCAIPEGKNITRE